MLFNLFFIPDVGVEVVMQVALPGQPCWGEHREPAVGAVGGKEPCTGAAAPAVAQLQLGGAQGAQHTCWLLGNASSVLCKLFSVSLCIYLFFPCPLLIYSPRPFHSLLDFAGIHSIFSEISDFKLSDFEGEAPWVTARLPPGT